MRYGTGLPLSGGAYDPVMLRDFAQAIEGAGIDTLTSGGHLLSAEPGRFPANPTPTYSGSFYEPFVVYTYLAAVTTRLVLRPSILILPLFPTALVAKQAAALALLSGGRFELGVGISWNTVEYAALGQDFHTRGRRLDEQLEVLRLLWGGGPVTFSGRWHQLDAIGIGITPPRIPIWIGASPDDRQLRRIARAADGWLPMGDPSSAMPRLREMLLEAGRDPATFRLTGRVTLTHDGAAAWVEQARRLHAIGVTEITLGTPPDLARPEALDRLIEGRRVLGEALA